MNYLDRALMLVEGEGKLTSEQEAELYIYELIGELEESVRQPWSEKTHLRVEELYKEMRRHAEERYEQLNSFLKKTARKVDNSCDILIDIKKLDSVMSKIERGKPAEKMTDVLRCAVLCDTDEKSKKVVESMTDTKNVIAHDPKLLGGNPWGYHGSTHLDLDINGMVVEAQVMTKKLWNVKDEAHKIYTKWRDLMGATDVNDTDEVYAKLGDKASEFFKDLTYSRWLFMVANTTKKKKGNPKKVSREYRDY